MLTSISDFLENHGLMVWVVGDKLRVAPPEKVTPEVADFIKAHKQTIMAELKNVIYRNPYPQGTPEARQESLIQIMDAIYQTAVKQAREAYDKDELIPDQQIQTMSLSVLEGKAKLKDFRALLSKAYLN